jgi:hypothetical protein
MRFLEVFCGSTAEKLTQANLNRCVILGRVPAGERFPIANFQLPSGSNAYGNESPRPSL